MEIIYKGQEDLRHVFNIRISCDMLLRKQRERLSELSNNMTMDGFRRGKIPLSVVEKKYGKEVEQEIVEKVIQDSIQEAIATQDIHPLGKPDVQFSLQYQKGEDLCFSMNVECFPDIEEKDYSNLDLPYYKVVIDPADLEEELKRLLLCYPVYEKNERLGQVVLGDAVSIDFVGSVDGQRFPGGESKGYHLVIGSNMFVPGFEDQIIGHSVGDVFVVRVKFPDNYSVEDLRSKDVEFSVTLNCFLDVRYPELDDAFAKMLHAENLEDLKNRIQSSYELQYEERAYARLKFMFLNELNKLYTFPLPERMLAEDLEMSLAEVKQMEALGQLSPKEQEMSELERQEYYKKLSLRRVRLGLVLAHVVRKEKMDVTPAEFQKAISQESLRHRVQEQKILEHYRDNPSVVSAMRGVILEDKALHFILQKISFERIEISVKDFLKLPPVEVDV